MGLGRYMVDAVVLEGRRPSELARSHGISQSWIYELVARFRRGGYPALEPGSRRPRSCPHQVRPEVQAAVLELRHDLSSAGWQADTTHWQLADRTDVEILNLIDDHSRLVLASVALLSVKAPDVHGIFISATENYGLPAALLCDNAAVFSGSPRRGKVVLEAELERLGIRCIHSTPYHPQTCGKVERFHQTLKRFLVRQAPAQSLALLQLQLDAFRDYYNQHRPHRALGGSSPVAAFNSRLKAKPDPSQSPTHFRVRKDKVDRFGRVTLRYLGRLHHIGLGLVYKNRPVRLLVAGAHVRVVTEEGSLLRELTLDPTRDYQPLGGRTLFRDVVRQASTMS